MKYELLQQSDIYLAPALYGESFGIVLLEAMAVGTPIAGFANAGYKNVITNEMSPHFSEPGDVDGLVKNIEGLLLSERRDSLAIHGLEEVKKYDWGSVTNEIEEIYKETIS